MLTCLSVAYTASHQTCSSVCWASPHTMEILLEMLKINIFTCIVLLFYNNKFKYIFLSPLVIEPRMFPRLLCMVNNELNVVCNGSERAAKVMNAILLGRSRLTLQRANHTNAKEENTGV